jgi:hypothetical protein
MTVAGSWAIDNNTKNVEQYEHILDIYATHSKLIEWLVCFNFLKLPNHNCEFQQITPVCSNCLAFPP